MAGCSTGKSHTASFYYAHLIGSTDVMGTYINTYIPSDDEKELKEKYRSARVGAIGEVERLELMIGAVSASARLGIKHLSRMHEIRFKNKTEPAPLLEDIGKLRKFIKSGKYVVGLKPDVEKMYDFYVRYHPTPTTPCMLERILDDIEAVCKHAKKYGLKVYFE